MSGPLKTRPSPNPGAPTVTRSRHSFGVIVGTLIAAALSLAAAAIALRAPTSPASLPASTPHNAQVAETSAESQAGNSLVTFPRQSDHPRGVESEPSVAELPPPPLAPTDPEEPPAGTTTVTQVAEAAAPDSPRRDVLTAVRLLASFGSAERSEAPEIPGDPLAERPDDTPSTEAEEPGEPPRGPDPTYSVPHLPSAESRRSAFEKLIAELLEQGWSAKSASLKAAGEKFRTANDLYPDDPRAYFAYGLVLLKHNQYNDALKQFDAVGKDAKPPYLPAYRAAIWLRVLRRAYEPVPIELVALTRAWQAFEPGRLSAWVQDDFVTWTGHLMGFLEGPVDNRSVDALCEICNAELRSLLTPQQWSLFKIAKNEVLESYASKSSAQEQTRIEAKKKQEKDADETVAKLAEESAQTKADRRQVEKSAEDMELNLRDQLAAIDAQIMTLARDYDRVDARARSLANHIRSLDQEIAHLVGQRTQLLSEQSSPPPSGTAKNGTTKPAPNTNNAVLVTINLTIDQKNREKLRYEGEHTRLEMQMRELQRQGLVLMNKRQNQINDYQKTTGRLYKEKETLVTREKFLERRQQEVARSATGSTTHVRVLAQTAKALRTYVDFNLELEKQRLLESFEKP